MTASATLRTLPAVSVVCAVSALACTTGCLIVDARVPDVRICPPPPEPLVESSPPVRYKPYAAALDRVLRQEARIEKELRKRDWNELGDELGDWQRYVRRLAGAADTAHDPALLRDSCETLQEHISAMRRAVRSYDALGVERALDEAASTLRLLSSEFPLTEPVTTQPAAEADV